METLTPKESESILSSDRARRKAGEVALSKENTMELERVEAMEMNCVICGERTAQVYDLHLPHDEVIITRVGLCDKDKEALTGLPSEERNAKLIEAVRRAKSKQAGASG
jgi:hypothetical protein